MLGEQFVAAAAAEWVAPSSFFGAAVALQYIRDSRDTMCALSTILLNTVRGINVDTFRVKQFRLDL